MNENDKYCAALVREVDRDRYLAALFAPDDRRSALFALYAFNIEISRTRDLAREPMPGEIRLQWWREVLEGERADEAKANPVAASLRLSSARDVWLSAGPQGVVLLGLTQTPLGPCLRPPRLDVSRLIRLRSSGCGR